MSEKYTKLYIEKNAYYSVFYGSGMYTKTELDALLHYDTDLTVTYFLSCSGNIKIEGKHYDINSGDVVIMNPNEIHCCNIDDNTYHERISVCINKAILKNFAFECKDFFDFFEARQKGLDNVIKKSVATEFKIDTLMKNILSLARANDNKNKVLCTCKITELLYQLGGAVSYHTVEKSDEREENPIISDALKYIGEHFTADIDCAKIAEKHFISKYRLEHLFKECLGISLWEYVIIKRLMLVNEFIQQKYPIEQAAYSAGFHNYSNFYRLYKKHFNMTPLQYKKSIKK